MPAATRFVRFGVFELDRGEGVLTKNGRKIGLQNQPFRILTLLVERPGETVSREQLRQALWSADTFVDFDRSLNAAVAKLRQALGDSADSPRYIETLAKRGYRFVAPIQTPLANGWNSVEPRPAEQPYVPPSGIAPKHLPRLGLASGSVSIALIAALLFVWNRRGQPPREATLTQLTSDTGLTIDPTVSRDSKWLAYASDRADGHHLNLWIQNLAAGSRPMQLTYGDQEARNPSFSADGSRIAFSCAAEAGGGICVAPSKGGAIARLADKGTAPRFSPDGRWISFQFGQNLTSTFSGHAMGQCYVIPSAGGVPHRIGADLKQISNPVWAPDNEHLLVYQFDWLIQKRDWYLVSKSDAPSKRTGLFGVLEKYGLSLDSNNTPRLSQWQEDHLIFSGAYGDGTNIWRIPVSNQAIAQGRPERLTLGTAIEASGSLSGEGDLYFEGLAQSDAIWNLALDADRALVHGDLSPLTQGPFDVLPSITVDGRFLAFSSARERSAFARNTETRLLDLQSKKEVAISEPGMDTDPHISSDGLLIAADERSPKGLDGVKGTRVLRIGDGLSRQVPDTAESWAFSHDDRRLLVSDYDHVIRCVDLRSGAEVFRFAYPGHTLYQASFAPGDGFIAVESLTARLQDSRIFIIRINNNVPEPPDRWIAIDHSSLWDDKPRWSPNGNLLYFLSDRDGRLCLWVQRLLPDTKRPIGAPFSIAHFHTSRLDLRNEGFGMLNIGVARDRAVFGIGELRGNIWSIKYRP